MGVCENTTEILTKHLVLPSLIVLKYYRKHFAFCIEKRELQFDL